MSTRTVDVAGLPDHAFGHRGLIWWGTTGFMVIEGSLLLMILVAYLILRLRTPEWPPGLAPPDWRPGALMTALLLASLIPNAVLKRAAERYDTRTVRRLLPLMVALGVVAIGVRVLEFPALRCRWDDNAYGSIVWALLGAHTLHLVTDAFDTAVLAVLAATRPIEPRRFVDIAENALYWIFVVLAWLPVYLTVVGGARWL
jgi:cytochrome c oxidase subunit 3